MQKDKRRKNLAFRPVGENPLHDKAICFMDQIGRGQSDFVASAVVYYAMMLAEGKVGNELAKQLNTKRFRAKILTAPTLSSENIYPVEDTKLKTASPIKAHNRTKASSAAPEESEKSDCNNAFGDKSPTEQVQPFDSGENVKSPLPNDMVQSLLKGFKIR